MSDSGPELRKTYRVVANPDVRHLKERPVGPFVWVVVGGLSCVLVVYITRFLANLFW